MSVISFFAGVGGIEYGFEQAGFEIIMSNEIDLKASETFRLNHSSPLITEDIHTLVSDRMDEIPDHEVLLAGFPCQAFSIAGYRRGFEDERGELFFEVLKVIVEKQPRIVFLENVKNLLSHDKGNTFKIIKGALEENGYKVKYKVMNGKDYGNVPQNRERIYIVAFREKDDYNNFEFPEEIEMTRTLDQVIDFEEQVAEKYYYTENNFKHFELLSEEVNSPHTVYQWRRKYVRENKSNVCPTLTATMGTGGHNVPIIYTAHGIRKLTPRECFRLQGFPENFVLPENMAASHLYKQAGNSVVVPVIRRIAENISKLFEEAE